MESRTWTIDDFEIGMKVGSGRFGNVYLARERKSKFVVAIKAVLKKELVRSCVVDLIQNEIDVQSHLSHPNILGLYGYFWDDTSIYIVMEYGFYGDLKKLLDQHGKFSERRAAWFIARIANAIAYMQDRGVIHRDIKAENVLLGDGFEPKLSDFGWAVRKGDLNRKTLCGTVPYMPPEVASGNDYGFEADLWCLGVLTYELCTGRTPFGSMAMDQVQDNIQKETLLFPASMTPLCKDFITGLLQEKSKRSSIQQVLSHPWIQSLVCNKKVLTSRWLFDRILPVAAFRNIRS